MPSPLLTLHYRLQHALENGLGPGKWAVATEMTKALASVKARFDTPDVSLSNRSIGKALLTFYNTGDLPNFIELKYACFGLAQQVGPGQWSLIEDAERFPAFLKRVDKEKANPRRFRKCYQGLMHSYFSYGIFDNPGEIAATNWQKLQRYLHDRLSVALSATNTPSWLRTLFDHENLLSSKPCERYAPSMVKGDASELAAAVEGIGIASTSWIWQEAMLAHTQAVVKKPGDEEYRALIRPLVDLLSGKGDISLSDTIVAKCAALLLIRYTKCKDRSEHPQLRDLAVDHIGNPWLNRAAWDAYVNNEDARKMVDGWLKRRLINDFFALLAQDGAANTRRLDYWLRFEPVIEDMWFVLGANAGSDNSPPYRVMKDRMKGRLHYLGSGTTADNNAFIMRIGQFMVVEFGVTGNACFVFHASELKIDPHQKTLRISTLKGDQHVARLLHSGPWEANFDSWLVPRVGWRPSDTQSGTARRQSGSVAEGIQTSTSTPLPRDPYKKFVMSYQLSYYDNRPKGGAFWIYTDDSDPVVTRQLNQMLFRYTPGKGWWKG